MLMVSLLPSLACHISNGAFEARMVAIIHIKEGYVLEKHWSLTTKSKVLFRFNISELAQEIKHWYSDYSHGTPVLRN